MNSHLMGNRKGQKKCFLVLGVGHAQAEEEKVIKCVRVTKSNR